MDNIPRRIDSPATGSSHLFREKLPWKTKFRRWLNDFKNTGTKNIHFTKFRFASSVAGTVEIHYVTGTASAVNAITPLNRYMGSSKTITATVGTNVDITGLTNAGTLVHLRLAAANTDYIDDAPSHIIVPPGQAIAFLWDTSTGILKGTVDIYEDQGVI